MQGLAGLDIGCGEGYSTRLLAQRGARMWALDVSDVFVRHAKETEAQEPLGIGYLVASAVEVPFAGSGFDFATGFMSFMDEMVRQYPNIQEAQVVAYFLHLRARKPGRGVAGAQSSAVPPALGEAGS